MYMVLKCSHHNASYITKIDEWEYILSLLKTFCGVPNYKSS